MDDSDVKVFGDHNSNVGNHHETHNYSAFSREELVTMIEERFHHILKKEEQIEMIFDENRKLTDELILQNAEFRLYNRAYRRLQEKNAKLNLKILGLTEKLSNKNG